MDSVMVILAALAATALIAWLFLAPRKAQVAREANGAESVDIVVQGGYKPSAIQIRAGRPVHLVFDRREEGECSSHVIFSDLGVDQALPAYKKTTLDLGPLKPGEYPFACGMNMLHGTMKVVES